jgi:hypothetical protein
MSVSTVAKQALRVRALGAYRQLMRTRVVVFENDTEMIVKSRVELRTKFTENRNLIDNDDGDGNDVSEIDAAAGFAKATALVDDAFESAAYFRENMLQFNNYTDAETGEAKTKLNVRPDNVTDDMQPKEVV